MAEHPSESIFLIEIDKIKPNPLQPRTEFDENRLKELAESIRQYGVLQPLVVVRKEQDLETGLLVEYELIAGERRLRAAKLAGLNQVPVIIRKEPAERVKLEMALVENIQREDLNAIERAKAFSQLASDFSIRHSEIASRVGKSREFVSNTIRLLMLPDEMQKALCEGLINEGHTRPLLMLEGREEQQTLFKEIMARKLSVREAERISRRIAYDRARKNEPSPDPIVRSIEEKLAEVLGTRVTIEKKGTGGKIFIEFFSDEELNGFLRRVGSPEPVFGESLLAAVQEAEKEAASSPDVKEEAIASITGRAAEEEFPKPDSSDPAASLKIDDGTAEELKSFTI